MCGIAGVLNLNGEAVSPVVIGKMTDAIAHRGPDGEGFFTEKYIGLGHRRLAIIDLSPAGHQPMHSWDGRYIITYNGEVYNFRELRVELESLGYQFHSQTDAEVVVNAWAQWGKKALLKFNGMFAFAVWDKENRQLTLVRDRYGIKPLYYTHQDDIILFGSEVKAILAHPKYQSDLDKSALLEYFTFQNNFTDRTLFKDVKLFPAGHFLTIDMSKNELPSPEIYWDFDFREPVKVLDEEEYIEELDRLFNQAVCRQLVSDVEIGAYLSGGIDSGSITAVAASQFPYLKSFTCGFDLNSASGLEMGYDEREAAEHMSYLFKTEHYEMVLKAGDMERILPKHAWHIEEPRVGQSYPNYYIAQLASKFVKVALAGVGGDEIFGGYPWRYYRAVVNNDFEHYVDKYYAFWQRLIPNSKIKQVFSPIQNEVKDVWTRDIFRDVFNKHASKLTCPEDYVNHSLYFEAKTFLHSLLVVEDKLSMAHGLETRVPFLDNDLVDFAMHVPVKYKLGNLSEIVRLNENEPGLKTSRYFNKTRDGKLLLRNAMKRYLPPMFTDGLKQGFSAPDASWFRGESIDYVRRKLKNKNADIYSFLNYKEVQILIDEHLEGKNNRRLFVWSLLCFENFCQNYL